MTDPGNKTTRTGSKCGVWFIVFVLGISYIPLFMYQVHPLISSFASHVPCPRAPGMDEEFKDALPATEHQLDPSSSVTSKKDSSLESQAQANNPSVANKAKSGYLSVTNGGIHGCARFSTRYEARHIIPWLYYHKRVGISFFHMYFDPDSSNFTNPVEKKAYDIMLKLPFVAIYDTVKLNITGQGTCLKHCHNEAHLERKAEWAMDFDIDEVLAFGDATKKTKADCKETENSIPTGALSQFVSEIPNHVLAVVIPRVIFGQNGIKKLPQRGSQMDLFTRRDDKAGSAKILARTNQPPDRKVNVNKHMVEAWDRDGDKIIYPCGEPVYPSRRRGGQRGDPCRFDGSSMCVFEMNRTQLPSELHLKAPRLHHYLPRSMEDCWRKIEDTTAPWRAKQGMSNWRNNKPDAVCNATQHDEVSDYSVYCASKSVEKELSQLFPAFDTAPHVF